MNRTPLPLINIPTPERPVHPDFAIEQQAIQSMPVQAGSLPASIPAILLGVEEVPARRRYGR